MTDIIFVNPPLSLKERYGSLEAGGSSAPPLALCDLAAVTREGGFDTKIIDSAALGLKHEETVKKILDENPKCVGITAATVSVYNAAKLADMLKVRNKNIVTVLGGPHITAVPIETMKRFPQFDIGVVGEGEITIIELLNKLKKASWKIDKVKLDNVSGLVIKKGKKIKLTKPRPSIKDLDSLPQPAWDLLPELSKHYRPPAFSFNRLPSTSIVTSRGCPGLCIFCDRAVFGNRLRGYSAEYVFKMMKELHDNYSVRDILIDDDSFVLLRKRLIELCGLLIKEKMNLTWACNARVDHMNPQILKLMKKAGCWQIAYGIESGNQKVLDVLNKRISLEQVKKALRWTKDAGIRTKGFFMIGSPLETKETIEDTIKFAKSTDLDDFQMSILTPFPGSELYRTAEKYGSLEDDWRKMNGWYPVFVPNGLTKNEILYYQRKSMMSFYLRPKIISSYLSMCIKRPKNIVKIFKGGTVLLKTSFHSSENF